MKNKTLSFGNGFKVITDPTGGCSSSQAQARPLSALIDSRSERIPWSGLTMPNATKSAILVEHPGYAKGGDELPPAKS